MDPAGTPHAGDSPAAVSPEAVREQCARILQSECFASAPTLRRLLEYLVHQSLLGAGGQLKEYSVGVEVFGRGQSFDPHTDTIVRAHARRLRRRLEDYYSGEGRADTVWLDLPKGHYAVRGRLCPIGRPPHVPTPSIVVLPFATHGGVAEDEYFADGLTDEIISALASLPGLHVVARTSAFQFKGRRGDVRQIGHALGVGLALEGSVRRERSAVRVAVTLADARDGFQLWAETYERDRTVVFQVQDEIARAVVSALRERLGPRASPVRTLAPRSAEAHDCYLKGRYFWNKATPTAVGKAIKYLEQAIALDPAYAVAHAGLADAYVFLATLESESPGPLMDAARKAAQAALDLEDLAEGHSAMATVHGIGDWNWTAAEAAFTRALELMPSFALARGGFAIGCLAPLRRHDEAVVQLQLAVRLDPLSVFLRTMLGQGLVLAGHPEEAVAELEEALELDPEHASVQLGLAWARIGTGDLAGAVRGLESAPPEVATFPNWAGHLGYALARLGRRAEAEQILHALLTRFPGPWVPAVDVAAIYNGLDHRDDAFEWLARARDLRSFDVAFVADDPRFIGLRDAPELDWLRRLNSPAR